MVSNMHLVMGPLFLNFVDNQNPMYFILNCIETLNKVPDIKEVLVLNSIVF